jgi:lysylphosphatidylglycerol synthetase-like protein (DUF2156 family)
MWSGFLLSLIAFFSYPFVFVWFPVTRDFPWANLTLFGLAAVLLLAGFRRAFAADRTHPTRSKIAGAILATLSVAIFGFFILVAFIIARQLPASHGAPQVGQKAPAFTLSDSNGKPVSLSELLSAPINGETGSAGTLARNAQQATMSPKGVILIFYRGYW